MLKWDSWPTGPRWKLSPQFYKNIRKLGKQLDKAGFVYQKKDEESGIIAEL